MKRPLQHCFKGLDLQRRQWFGISALLFIMVGFSSMTYPIEELSKRLDDLYFRIRGTQSTSKTVAMVVIDDASLARYGRWPWSRHILAKLLRAASAQHPRVLALDILLAEPENEKSDSELSDVIRSAGNVVLAAKISNSTENGLWVEPLPRFSSAAAGVGHVQTVIDADGICRRIPISEPTIDGPRQAFALEAAQVAESKTSTGSIIRTVSISHPLPSPDSLNIEKMSLDLMAIDYRGQSSLGQSSAPFVTVSAQDLLEGKDRNQLRGKAVLVGFGATELSDRFWTPISDHLPMPGVEINANLLDQVLAQRDLRSLPEMVQLLLLLALCLLATWIVLRWPGRAGLVALAVMIVSAYGCGFLLFICAHRQIEFGPLLCAGVLAAPLAQLANLMFVERSVTLGLRSLERVLSENSPNVNGRLRRAFSSRQTTFGGLQWKVELLRRLQSELVSLYAFDNTLLEAMHEGLAVFAGDGRSLYQNVSWKSFCEKQKWNALLNLNEFIALLGNPTWSGFKVLEPGELLESEISLNGGLWHLRAVRLPVTPKAEEATFMLTVGDLTARLERDQARAEAIGFITHELRAPLTAIQGFAELMLREGRPLKENNARATIFRESKRLVAMVSTYLDVLRLDAGNRSLQLGLIPTEKIVRHVEQLIRPLAEAAGIILNLTFDTNLPAFQGDINLISGALLNVLSDAVKSSKRGSEVKLEIFRNEAEVVFELCAFMPGVSPKNQLSDIFETSCEAGNNAIGVVSRRGLGLSFARRIVEKHGGILESGGGGNYLRMTIPCTDAELCEVMT